MIQKAKLTILAGSDSSATVVVVGAVFGDEHLANVMSVADPDNEEAIFADVKAQYYAHRGKWRKHLNFYDVVGVERVEVSI